MKYPLLITMLLAAASVGGAAEQPITSFQAVVSGKGAPVILIPGLACSGEVWNETVAHLNAEGFETHTLTLAGFGGTKPLTVDNFTATVREDLARYIEEQHLVKPVVIGHSLGGFLALWLAEEHPDLPGKVISVDGLPFLAAVAQPGSTPESAKRAAKTLKAVMLQSNEQQYRARARETLQSMVTSPANVERELKVDLSSDRGTVAEAMAELWGTDLRPELGKIKCPVLVLGSWINYQPYGATHETAAALYEDQFTGDNTVQVEMNDKAKHFIQLDDPPWFYAQVDKFLGSK